MKSLTRRELLFEAFAKDTLKSIASACNEFKKASNAKKALNCDEVALMLGKKAKRYTKKFFQK